MLLGTTEDFLRTFGVQSLDELPEISAELMENFKEEAEIEAGMEEIDDQIDGQMSLDIKVRSSKPETEYMLLIWARLLFCSISARSLSRMA